MVEWQQRFKQVRAATTLLTLLAVFATSTTGCRQPCTFPNDVLSYEDGEIHYADGTTVGLERSGFEECTSLLALTVSVRSPGDDLSVFDQLQGVGTLFVFVSELASWDPSWFPSLEVVDDSMRLSGPETFQDAFPSLSVVGSDLAVACDANLGALTTVGPSGSPPGIIELDYRQGYACDEPLAALEHAFRLDVIDDDTSALLPPEVRPEGYAEQVIALPTQLESVETRLDINVPGTIEAASLASVGMLAASHSHVFEVSMPNLSSATTIALGSSELSRVNLPALRTKFDVTVVNQRLEMFEWDDRDALEVGTASFKSNPGLSEADIRAFADGFLSVDELVHCDNIDDGDCNELQQK